MNSIKQRYRWCYQTKIKIDDAIAMVQRLPLRWCVLLLWTVIPCCQLMAEDSLSKLEQQAFREAVALVDQSVVQIQTVGGTDKVGDLFIGTGPTTGLIVSSEGDIITSAFAFANKPSSVVVRLGDGRQFAANIVATDHLRKLTLLKIDLSGLMVADIKEQENVRVGAWSIAVGRTYALDRPNVSVGIVSAVDRIWGKAIQTDAKISPMNYGGPLVDLAGKVMGILVPMNVEDDQLIAGVDNYDSGIGFAIPIDDVMECVNRLRTGKDLVQGKMGVTFKAQSFQALAVVDQVRQGSPAESAGLKTDDRIIKANGIELTRIGEFKHVIGKLYGGDRLTMTVRRGDDDIEMECLLVDHLEAYQLPSIGIIPQREVATAKKPSQESNEEINRNGVIIRGLIPEGPAMKAGLKVGTRIIAMDHEDVSNIEELKALIGRRQVGETVKLKVIEETDEDTIEVTLSAMTATIPESLPSVVVSVSEEEKLVNAIPTGFIEKKLPGYERSYQAFIPESFPKDFLHAVVIWLPAPGETIQEELLRTWTSVCHQRGIILLAPLPQEGNDWSADDVVFIGDCLGDLEKTYQVHQELITLLVSDETLPMSLKFYQANSVPVQGIILQGNKAEINGMANVPDRRLSILSIFPEDDQEAERFSKFQDKIMTQAKIPFEAQGVEMTDEGVLGIDAVEQIGRWIDALNRI